MSTTDQTRQTASRTATMQMLRTEGRLFAREPGALFWIVVFPSVLLAILGSIPSFRDADPDLGGQSVIDLYVPIAVLLSMLMAAIQMMPGVITGYRERGILRRLRATPIQPGALLGAHVVWNAAAVVVSSALVLTVGRLAFGTPLPRSGGYLLAWVLAVASVLSLGAVVTAVSPTTKVSAALGSVVFFPSMFTAGVWLPVQAMPDLMQDIVLFTPLGAAAEALNDATLGQFPGIGDLAVVASWTVVLSAVAVRWFRWE